MQCVNDIEHGGSEVPDGGLLVAGIICSVVAGRMKKCLPSLVVIPMFRSVLQVTNDVHQHRSKGFQTVTFIGSLKILH